MFLTSSLFIVGAAVSVVLSMLKAKYRTLTGWQTRFVLILISLGIASVYHILVAFKLLETAYTILATASLVYAFFIKKR